MVQWGNGYVALSLRTSRRDHRSVRQTAQLQKEEGQGVWPSRIV
jgi:hypothetical protein